jgi:segregation and condensation protein B
MELKLILEAALLAAGRPLSVADLGGLFGEAERPAPEELRGALAALAEDCQERPVELKQVASGFRLQVREAYSPWVSRLFEERAGRYSRALLETLAIVAYRQPVTRGEIEDIRGVAVNTAIVRTLIERNWVQEVGRKEVPGRPALLATTRYFLDYFGLKSLADLPPMQAFADTLDPEAPPQDSQATPDHAQPLQATVPAP